MLFVYILTVVTVAAVPDAINTLLYIAVALNSKATQESFRTFTLLKSYGEIKHKLTLLSYYTSKNSIILAFPRQH